MRNSREKEINRNSTYDLQQMLYEISKFENGKPDILPDGVFEDKTTQAIVNFQNKNNIEPTGIADFETWDAISEKYNDVIYRKSRPMYFHFFKAGETPQLKLGDSEDAVYPIQLLFRKLSKDFIGYTDSGVNGIFDEQTRQNVIEFQRVNNLRQHGDVDRETWDAIAMYYNMF